MSTWYLDPVSGNDATTATPYGWWSIAYTAGSGTQPPNVAAGVAGTACSKGAASAYINYCTVTSGTWAGGDAAGTLYFYGKSGTFTAGTLTITSATCTIGGDLTYCAWQTITSGATSTRIAAGDTIAIAKSPTPYSIGTAAWTSNTNKGGALPATLAITGTASGTGGVVRLTVSATGTFSNGMVVQVVGVTGTVEANGTWIVSVYDSTHLELTGSVYSHAWVSGGTVQNVTAKAVVLSTPQTANINTGAALNVAWTAANSSTVTLVAATSSKIASGASKIAKTSPSTNTLYAYQATGTLNLSSYQNISFSILNNTAILANNWKICLCSDTAGATPVNTFNIPAIPLTSNFVMLNLPSGGNLGSSIKSIALYSGSSAATTAGITLGNFIACTSSGLNLTSLISTNPNEQTTTGTPEGWFGIQSIDPTGTIILLDNTATTASVGGAGYFGTTQSATTYARETIKTTMLASIGNVQTFQKSGTVGNNISYIGGYNPVTNLQTGETFFDGQNGVGEGFYTNSLSYLTIDRLNGVRYTDGFEIYASSFITILNLSVSNNSTNGLLINSSVDCQINNVLYANNNGTYGVQYSSANVCTINNIYNANGNGTSVYWNYCYGSTLLHLGNACNGSNAVTFSNATNNYIGTVG